MMSFKICVFRYGSTIATFVVEIHGDLMGAYAAIVCGFGDDDMYAYMDHSIDKIVIDRTSVQFLGGCYIA